MFLSESIVDGEKAHPPLALRAVIEGDNVGFITVANGDLPFLGRDRGHGGRGRAHSQRGVGEIYPCPQQTASVADNVHDEQCPWQTLSVANTIHGKQRP